MLMCGCNTILAAKCNGYGTIWYHHTILPYGMVWYGWYHLCMVHTIAFSLRVNNFEGKPARVRVFCDDRALFVAPYTSRPGASLMIHSFAETTMDNPESSESTEPTTGDNPGGGTITEEKKTRRDGRAYIQKNSLTEAELVKAREETRTNLKRKAKEELTEDDKREDRRAANRLSAFQSRQRRKMIIEDLQKTVAEQSKHNAEQGKEIADLKRQLQAARQDNELLRHQLASSGQVAFPAAQLFGAGAQMPGANPLMQQMAFQQNPLLQNAMLQNALLFSAQAQQQARAGQMINGAPAPQQAQPSNGASGPSQDGAPPANATTGPDGEQPDNQATQNQPPPLLAPQATSEQQQQDPSLAAPLGQMQPQEKLQFPSAMAPATTEDSI